MKSFVKSSLAIAAITVMTACGGGGGGNTSTGGTYFTHSQLASEFVRRLNIDVSGYDVSLVKTNTEQYDYIVIYDQSYGTYDAYYIGNYNPGENMASYLNMYEYKFYYDLIPQGNNYYKDFLTGKIFEVEDSSSMNVEKVAALQEMAAINNTARTLREEYGMSEEASLDSARFAVNISKAQSAGVDTRAMDRFAQKLTGSTITQFQNDIKNGNSNSFNNRLEMAKDKTGMSDEGIEKLFGL
jgi:hypothetical protein